VAAAHTERAPKVMARNGPEPVHADRQGPRLVLSGPPMKEVDKQPMREGGVKRTPRRTNGTEEGPNTRRIPEAESTKPATYKSSLKSTSARRKRKIAWRSVFV